jgi:hypothetical protein
VGIVTADLQDAPRATVRLWCATCREACVVEGFRCIAIEREATYLPLITNRLTKPIPLALDFDLLGG